MSQSTQLSNFGQLGSQLGTALQRIVAGSSLLEWALSLAVGLGLALAVQGLIGSVLRRGNVTGLDEQAPPLWRRVRWLIWLFEPIVAPIIPRRWRTRIQQQLREAGLELALGVEHIVAGQLLAALGLGAIVLILVSVLGVSTFWAAPAFALGLLLPASRLSDRVRRRRARLNRDLPGVLDLLSLALQGGAGLSQALDLAAERSPHGPLRDELGRVLREVRAGRARHEALHDMAKRSEQAGLRHAVAAMINSEKQGGDLCAVLAAQADQRRHERFLEAERLAMQAPVKLLLPLVVFIFPGTFLVLMFPVVMRLLGEGLL